MRSSVTAVYWSIVMYLKGTSFEIYYVCIGTIQNANDPDIVEENDEDS